MADDAKAKRDRLFLQIIFALVGLALLLGFGTVTMIIVLDPSDDVIVRAISSFGAIFSGILGICTGYLIGARTNGNGG